MVIGTDDFLWIVDRDDLEFSIETEPEGIKLKLADLDVGSAVRVWLHPEEARLLLNWLKEHLPES